MANEASFTWLGHAAVRVDTSEGKTLLIDPFFGDGRTPAQARDVDRLDAILLTHGHFDHLGETVELARRFDCPVVCNHEISVWLEGQDVTAVGMNIGGTVEVAGCGATMVPAVHSSGISGEKGIVDGGNPAGFVLRLPGGPVLYHSGDTFVFGDMALVAELYRPTLGFVCIGGHFTMGPREAARAIDLLGLASVVPIHWGTFPVLTGTPDALESELRKAGSTAKVVRAEPGRRQPLAGILVVDR